MRKTTTPVTKKLFINIPYRLTFLSGTWLTTLKTAGLAMQSFYDFCFDAGPDACDFYADSPAAIEKNLKSLYDTLRARPVPVWTKTAYSIIDYTSLRSTVFISLWLPYVMFPALAQGLADLAKGNGTAIQALSGSGARFECSCSEDDDLTVVGDGGIAIYCNDAAQVPNTLQDTESYLKELKEVSEWWDSWGATRTGCS